MNFLVLIAALLTQSAPSQQVQPGVVTGQLMSRDGRPAAGVRVGALAVPETASAVSSTSTVVGFTQTDSAGRYRIENIPPGRYYVIAGFVESPSYYPGGNSIAGATAIDVTSASPVRGIDFTMMTSAGVKVKGRAIRPPSQPGVLPQRISLSAGTLTFDTSINTDGTFEFQRVRPGNYRISVSGSPGTLATPAYVTVGENDVADLRLVLNTINQFSGSLVVEGGGPLPRFLLSFIPLSGSGVQSSMTIVGSNFSISLTEGEYQVSGHSVPEGYVLKSITSGSTDMLTNPLKVVAGTSIPPFVVTLSVSSPPPWVKVSGRVSGMSEIGVLGPLRLSLAAGSNAAQVFNAPVSSDGSFEFPMVLPGTYDARLTPELPVASPTRVIVQNKDASGIEIAFPPMKNLSGHVTIEGGGTASRLHIDQVDLSGAVLSNRIIPDIHLNPENSFNVVLPQGEIRIKLTVPGFLVKSISYGSADLLRDPLRISNGDTAELNIVLTAPATSSPGSVVGR